MMRHKEQCHQKNPRHRATLLSRRSKEAGGKRRREGGEKELQ